MTHQCQRPARGPILTNLTERNDYNGPQFVNIGAISNGEESSSQNNESRFCISTAVGRLRSDEEEVNVAQMHV